MELDTGPWVAAEVCVRVRRAATRRCPGSAPWPAPPHGRRARRSDHDRSWRWAAAGSRRSRTTRSSTTGCSTPARRSARGCCSCRPPAATTRATSRSSTPRSAAGTATRRTCSCSTARSTTCASLILSQDVVYVGGGNTVNLLAVWRAQGIDRILREAWERGVVLAGLCAGSMCWFEGGVTAAFGTRLVPVRGRAGAAAGQQLPALPHAPGRLHRGAHRRAGAGPRRRRRRRAALRRPPAGGGRRVPRGPARVPRGGRGRAGGRGAPAPDPAGPGMRLSGRPTRTPRRRGGPPGPRRRALGATARRTINCLGGLLTSGGR